MTKLWWFNPRPNFAYHSLPSLPPFLFRSVLLCNTVLTCRPTYCCIIGVDLFVCFVDHTYDYLILVCVPCNPCHFASKHTSEYEIVKKNEKNTLVNSNNSFIKYK